MSDLIQRLRTLAEYWNRRDALAGFKAVEMAVETVVVSAMATAALEAQTSRITELEAAIAAMKVEAERVAA